VQLPEERIEGAVFASGEAHGQPKTAQREHSLLSLMELSQELSVSLDLYELADLVLFNLMGQTGASKSALWVFSEENPGPPVLLRGHGLPMNWARALGAVCSSLVSDERFSEASPLLVSEVVDSLGPSHRSLVEDAEIALLVPVVARGNMLGIIALGDHPEGTPYSADELQVLKSCTGMIGVALQNTSLYNNLREKHRLLRQANENLRELDRLKSEFLRNVNHELRTPLTIIMAYSEALFHAEADEVRGKEFLQTILRESRKLMAMLEKLLDFSAISEDRASIQLEEGDLRLVLETFYSERVPGVAEGYREFSFAADRDVPAARFDRQRLLEILDAILDNAIKFTPPGSRICLWLKAHVEGGQPWAKIEIEDDGPGIPADRMKGLFDSFRQGDGSTSREVGGMGMGLAFAKKLADQMGARLDATSEVGRGSMFTLLVPGAGSAR
jgi:signal transduction histidine kinase